MVELLCAQWPGPISLSIYISDAEAAQLESFAVNSEVLTNRKNLAVHVVYKEGVSKKPKSSLTCKINISFGLKPPRSFAVK
jgi:hypothetical protein